MGPSEAKAVIDEYRACIKDLRPAAIVQSETVLRRTPAFIKYSHFAYGEYLVKEGAMNDEMLNLLMESYGFIHGHFVKDPDHINAKYREYIDGLNRGVITDFRFPNPFGEPAAVLEYFNFIGECYVRNRMGNLEPVGLGAFIYEGVLKKSRDDRDIETLRNLAGSPITRAIKLS